MDLVSKMVEHHVWLVGEMVDHGARLSDEQLDSPIEISVQGVDDSPTTRSLLSRLIGQMAMWNAAVAGHPYDFAVEAREDLPSMRTRLATEGPAFHSVVREVVQQGRLDETFVDATCDPPEIFSYGGMIAHVLTFAAHRRTLVLGAFADAGITDLGAGDPMRWVATTPESSPPPSTVELHALAEPRHAAGDLIADPARGLVYGNRGCLHDTTGTIRRRYAVRRGSRAGSSSAGGSAGRCCSRAVSPSCSSWTRRRRSLPVTVRAPSADMTTTGGSSRSGAVVTVTPPVRRHRRPIAL